MGSIEEKLKRAFENGTTETVEVWMCECPTCGGRGEINVATAFERRCPTCRGTGRVIHGSKASAGKKAIKAFVPQGRACKA